MVIQVIKCLLIKILRYYRRANYFQGFKISRILKISLYMKIFVEKFRGYGQPAKFITARGDKICDQFEDVSVIRTTARHHIYKDILCPQLEIHSRAEKNPTMIKIVLLWLLTKTILNDRSVLSLDMCLEPFQYRAICFEERRHNFI